jgi:hypothetical protein
LLPCDSLKLGISSEGEKGEIEKKIIEKEKLINETKTRVANLYESVDRLNEMERAAMLLQALKYR